MPLFRIVFGCGRCLLCQACEGDVITHLLQVAEQCLNNASGLLGLLLLLTSSLAICHFHAPSLKFSPL